MGSRRMHGCVPASLGLQCWPTRSNGRLPDPVTRVVDLVTPGQLEQHLTAGVTLCVTTVIRCRVHECSGAFEAPARPP